MVNQYEYNSDYLTIDQNTTDIATTRKKSDSDRSDNTKCSKTSKDKLKTLKIVKFLNTASSFWSKQLCLNK
jgi:hypothetical protein